MTKWKLSKKAKFHVKPPGALQELNSILFLLSWARWTWTLKQIRLATSKLSEVSLQFAQQLLVADKQDQWNFIGSTAKISTSPLVITALCFSANKSTVA